MSANPLQAFRVVIADDDRDIRGLIRVSCNKAGGNVVAEAGDGAAAWEAIMRERPDLVILDVAMPNMSGLQVCCQIRAQEALSRIKILLLSAAVDEESIRAGMSAGADDYISKPFSPRQLVARITEQTRSEP